MSFLAKICGLKTNDAIEVAIDHGATHLGFIFFEKSPRHITPELAGLAAQHARQYARDKGLTAPSLVAVTVNADDGTLDEIVAAMKPDCLQLHGSETPERVRAVAKRYALPLIKAFAIREARDFDKIDAYQGLVDLFLFDAKPPKGSDLPGGNGVSFDWSLLAHSSMATPYLLSGGLDADNISEALTIANPPGIDMSSGVESAPGVKDPRKIASFLQKLPLDR